MSIFKEAKIYSAVVRRLESFDLIKKTKGREKEGKPNPVLYAFPPQRRSSGIL